MRHPHSDRQMTRLRTRNMHAPHKFSEITRKRREEPLLYIVRVLQEKECVITQTSETTRIMELKKNEAILMRFICNLFNG